MINFFQFFASEKVAINFSEYQPLDGRTVSLLTRISDELVQRKWVEILITNYISPLFNLLH
jgi:hypothetical protein